jgi:hypothetical protein
VNRVRWLILILGPLPIVGSSWAVSAWFSEPRLVVMRNSVLPGNSGDPAPAGGPASPQGDPSARLAADCAETAGRLRAMLGPECQVVVETPFVLGGDLERGELATLYAKTIAPAVRAMRHCYFDARPSRPVSVLLFRGEKSYNRYCEELFGDRGISIYGYYKPKLRTLVLNIGTGSGTLLHELTHALVDFDFPEVPDWLNEGLASLHEQSRFRGGAAGPWIEGLPNWRLAGLQEVVRSQKLGSLKELVENPRFRGRGEGTNYAQARYFCLYMQQQGVLADFYRAFRDAHADDPRGRKALAQAFPRVDIDQLDRDFQRWVVSLSETN